MHKTQIKLKFVVKQLLSFIKNYQIIQKYADLRLQFRMIEE